MATSTVNDLPAWPLVLHRSADGTLKALVWHKNGSVKEYESNANPHDQNWTLYEGPLEGYLVPWLQTLCDCWQAYKATSPASRDALPASHVLRTGAYAATIQSARWASALACDNMPVVTAFNPNNVFSCYTYIVQEFINPTLIDFQNNLSNYIEKDARRSLEGIRWHRGSYLINPVTGPPQPPRAVIPLVPMLPIPRTRIQTAETAVSLSPDLLFSPTAGRPSLDRFASPPGTPASYSGSSESFAKDTWQELQTDRDENEDSLI